VWHLPPISPTTLELERSFAQRVGKAERQYTLLITSTDFVYIVYITFENPNRFRCKIYSWGKGLDVDRSSSDPSTRSITKPFVTQTLKCPIYSCFDVKHPAGLAFNAQFKEIWCSVRVILVLLILAGQFLAFSAFTCCVRSNNK
jgi:hypothetical protein